MLEPVQSQNAENFAYNLLMLGFIDDVGREGLNHVEFMKKVVVYLSVITKNRNLKSSPEEESKKPKR